MLRITVINDKLRDLVVKNVKIGICNQKGGVGKTTTAINLASYLAVFGRDVLLIDMDPQAAATSGVGIEKVDGTIYDVLVGDKSIEDVVISSKVENLSVIPSNISLAGAEVEFSNEVGREFLLKDALDSVEFDYIIVDSPPNLGVLTLNAMIACVNLLVPIQAEYYALEGLAQLIKTINLIKKRLKIELKPRYLITMYDSRTKLSEEVSKQIREYFKDRVFKTIIPRNVRLAEAPSHGLPIHLYDESCKGALAYKKLAEEVDSVEW